MESLGPPRDIIGISLLKDKYKPPDGRLYLDPLCCKQILVNVLWQIPANTTAKTPATIPTELDTYFMPLLEPR